MNKIRYMFSALMFLAVLSGSAPLVVALGLIGVFRFPRYSEFLVAGFLFELLYGAGGWHFPFPFPMFFGPVVIFILAEFIRTRLR